MFTCIQKHNQFHGLLWSHLSIVFVKVFLYFLNKFVEILHLAIRSVLSLSTCHKVSENNSFGLHFVGPFMLLFVGLILWLAFMMSFNRCEIVQLIAYLDSLCNENIFVFFRNQAVVINSGIFMVPKMNEIFHWTDIFRIGRANSLNYFPNVSQVECIMRFRGSWQQLCFDKFEDFQTKLTDMLGHIFGRLRESLKVKA